MNLIRLHQVTLEIIQETTVQVATSVGSKVVFVGLLLLSNVTIAKLQLHLFGGEMKQETLYVMHVGFTISYTTYKDQLQ
jgi:hypothetical protein